METCDSKNSWQQESALTSVFVFVGAMWENSLNRIRENQIGFSLGHWPPLKSRCQLCIAFCGHLLSWPKDYTPTQHWCSLTLQFNDVRERGWVNLFVSVRDIQFLNVPFTCAANVNTKQRSYLIPTAFCVGQHALFLYTLVFWLNSFGEHLQRLSPHLTSKPRLVTFEDLNYH